MAARAKSTKPAPIVDKPRGKPRTMPGRNGGTLLVGPTNKGGPGRPPNEFKQRMAALADRGAQAAETARVLDNPDHPHWLNAWKFATEQAHGRAVQPISGDPEAPLTIRIVRE